MGESNSGITLLAMKVKWAATRNSCMISLSTMQNVEGLKETKSPKGKKHPLPLDAHALHLRLCEVGFGKWLRLDSVRFRKHRPFASGSTSTIFTNSDAQEICQNSPLYTTYSLVPII